MQLNHALLLATNIQHMAQFLESSLGLKKGPRPAFGFDGVWLYDELDTPCIHIAAKFGINESQSDYLTQASVSTEAVGLSTVDHLAFFATDYQEVKARLEATSIPFVEREVPAANEHQVFIQGPDGLKIEILFTRSELI